MRKAPKNLLNITNLVLKHPEVEKQLHGLGAVYGKVIFAARMEQGLTQIELAEKAQVDLITITKAEGGFENLGTVTYNNLFNALNLTRG